MEPHTFEQIENLLRLESEAIINLIANEITQPSITMIVTARYYNDLTELEKLIAKNKKAISDFIERG